MQATQAMRVSPRDMNVLFSRLVDLERATNTQEWWMFGRILPEATQLAELASLVTVARAELGQMLSLFGFPQIVNIEHLGTSELQFAQSFSSDEGWALAHRDEALSALRLAAFLVPSISNHVYRIRHQLGVAAGYDGIGRVLERLTQHLDEARDCLNGY
jgi:hypothetical protein